MPIRTVHDPIGIRAVVRSLEVLRPEDYPVEVRWGPPRRTNQQNAYLWGVVYGTIAEALTERTGHVVSRHGIHALCKDKFCPRVAIPGLNETVPMSTTELTRRGNEESFQDYVMQIQEMAAKLGIYVPDPNEEI